MHEIIGDLWEEHAAGAVVAITTSAKVSKAGNAVLLRGCARQARDRFPGLASKLGVLIRHSGSHVFNLDHRIVNFPVEEDPYRIPELGLIEQSCKELVALTDDQGWDKVVVPRPGCGCGGLKWSEVKPVLIRYFDERFYIITK